LACSGVSSLGRWKLAPEPPVLVRQVFRQRVPSSASERRMISISASGRSEMLPRFSCLTCLPAR